MKLQGKVVVIIGVGLGIGCVIVFLFVSEGVKFVIGDKSDGVYEIVKVICVEGGDVMVLQMNVGKEVDVKNFVQIVRMFYGGFDIVYVNVGIFGGLFGIFD